MVTRTNKRSSAKTTAPVDTRETVSSLDESLPKQTPSLPGQQAIAADLPKVEKVKLPVVARPGLVEFLKKHDLIAFLDDWPLAEMRRIVDATYGTSKSTRVTAAELQVAGIAAFDWYRRIRLLPERTTNLLSWDQWDNVKLAVEKLLVDMHGRTLRQCVRIARTRVSCSAAILRGLPKRFHVWSESK